mmetsp:Transcript_67978/g.133679  ORF Transcript_67978/g.133679 Transcript_67978/m.133679 type:complete len:410 (+) Transcript_67978:45-1274(+)
MRFISQFVLVFFTVLLLSSSAAKKSTKKSTKTSSNAAAESNDDSAVNRKIAAITKAISHRPVISLTDSNFTKYVTDRPRDYHAVLLFTATAPKYQCSVCVRSMTSYEEIAEFYNQQYQFNTTSIESRVVFFKIEVDNGRSIFNELGLETVPRLYILPPVAVGAPKAKISNYEVSNQILLEGTSRVIEELTNKTGVKVEITVSPDLLLLALGLFAILAALFVSAAKGDFYGAVLWYQSPKIWVVVSSICFAVGVSGSIFCVIKSAPLMGMTRKGVSIFATQGRDQFLLEGVIIASITLLSALSAYLMSVVTKIRYPVLKHIIVLLCLAIWIVLGTYIFSTYRLKTGWYNLKDTFPPELWHWISSSVKKSSTLAKRLFRVSEIWLYESKDFAAFQKKAQALVVDYVLGVKK